MRWRPTSVLIALNVGVYLLLAIRSGAWGSFPSDLLASAGGVYAPAVALSSQWWRLVTAMFLHGGLEHLAVNMVSLYIVGRIMEAYFRPRDYLTIYLVSGVAGFAASMAVHPTEVSVGASGAIFGIFGAIAGYVFFHRRTLGGRFGLFMREFGVVLALNLVIGLAVPTIDMSAHVAGLIVGGISGYLATYHRGAYWAWILLTLSGVWWTVAVYVPGLFAPLPWMPGL